ncbi:transposase [Akkermansiaceae bacterium]|nr:transposase [Akkermansiaceae bacterium]
MEDQNRRKPTRRKYDQEFKEEAVRLVLEGQSATGVAADLGIGVNLFYRWKSKVLDEGRFPAKPGWMPKFSAFDFSSKTPRGNATS